eukprot:443770-Pelagomonas_calceolata.AAC.4
MPLPFSVSSATEKLKGSTWYCTMASSTDGYSACRSDSSTLRSARKVLMASLWGANSVPSKSVALRFARRVVMPSRSLSRMSLNMERAETAAHEE